MYFLSYILLYVLNIYIIYMHIYYCYTIRDFKRLASCVEIGEEIERLWNIQLEDYSICCSIHGIRTTHNEYLELSNIFIRIAMLRTRKLSSKRKMIHLILRLFVFVQLHYMHKIQISNYFIYLGTLTTRIN